MTCPTRSFFGSRNQFRNAVRFKFVALCLVELALELHPMQPQSVQEALEHIHSEKHGTSNTEPCRKHDVHHDASRNYRCCIVWVCAIECHAKSLLKENEGKLLMRKGQSPDTQVGRSVRHRAKHILDRLNDLMNEHFTEFELF